MIVFRHLVIGFECVASYLSSFSFSDEIAKLFPHVFGQPSTLLVPSDSDVFRPDQKLKIGVVLSGGQAPGGHNVISGIYGEDLTELVIRRRFINY